MYEGSCLCGEVRYEINGELGPINFCHCSRCRKANGSAFLAAAEVNPDNLTVVAGADLVGDYESSPGVHRRFCRTCGSPLYSWRPGPPARVRLRIGTLDTPLDRTVAAHIFWPDRAEWYHHNDDAPTFVGRAD